MRVRTATPTDLPRLVELMRATPTAAQWTEEQFAKTFEDGEGKRVVLVVEAEASVESRGAAGEEQIPFGKLRAGSRSARNDNSVRDSDFSNVQGFAVAHRIGPECEVENVVVNPPLQRHGLGQNLLRELLNHLRGKACEAVFLEVRESNLPARALYVKCGFREVGRRMKYYLQPQEDAVLYRFSFEPAAAGMVQT